MSSPLHTATVGVFLQILPQIARLLTYFENKPLSPEAQNIALNSTTWWSIII